MSLERLRELLAGRRRFFAPFIMLGDPDPASCADLAVRAVEAGAGMLELGLPYDDPCADGPDIQAACARARAHGVSTSRAFEILHAIRTRVPSVPLNLLVYGNLVHARGYGNFCRDAAAAGASSLLVPDVPLEESAPLRAACADAALGHVPLAGPDTPPARIAALATAATAFVYLTSYRGTTGGGPPAEDRRAVVRRACAAVHVPVCVGFGLETEADLREVFTEGARIAVVGSHLARLVASGSGKFREDHASRCRTFAAVSMEETPHVGDHAS